MSYPEKLMLSGQPSQPGPGAVSTTVLWLLLPMRLVMFGCLQALISLVALAFVDDPWRVSIAWWPLAIILANFITISVLARSLRAEGQSYRNLFRVDRERLVSDIPILFGLVISIAALAFIPNILLATLFFGSPEAASEMFVLPLPVWAAWIIALAFPVSIALAEFPLYFAYIMPRLETATGSAFFAVTAAAFFAAAQHVTMPLIFDWHFVAWRLLMFIPFTLLLAIALR